MRYALFYDVEKQPPIIFDIQNQQNVVGQSAIKSIDLTRKKVITDKTEVSFTIKENKRFEAKLDETARGNLPPNIAFCDHVSWRTQNITALPRFRLKSDFRTLSYLNKDFYFELNQEEIVDLSEFASFDYLSENKVVRTRVESALMQVSESNGFAVLFNTYNIYPSITRMANGYFVGETVHYANWKCVYSDGACHSRINGNLYFVDHSKLRYKHYAHTGIILPPSSYAHFLAQTVPILYNVSKLIRRGLIDRRDFIFIAPVNNLLHAPAQYFIKLFGLEDIPIVDPGKEGFDVFGLDRLLISTHEGNFPPFLYENSIAEAFADVSPVRTIPQDKPVIVIASRQDVGNRRGIVNENELIEKLQEKDYTTVVVRGSQLTFDEQKNIFSNASLVIGPHGANMANATFAPRDAPIIELVNDHVDVNVFWYMNFFNRLQRRYHLMNFTSDGDGWVSPFIIDADAVVLAVERLLGRAGQETNLG